MILLGCTVLLAGYLLMRHDEWLLAAVVFTLWLMVVLL